MITKIATYRTRTGLVALEITRRTHHDGRITYDYDGKHGSGSGHDLPHVRGMVRLMLDCYRGIRLAEGQDIFSPDFTSDPHRHELPAPQIHR